MTKALLPRTRLYVENDLRPAEPITLGRDHSHYLRSVLRFAVGDEVRLFNERSGEWLGRLATLSKTAAKVDILSQLRNPIDEPDIWLVFAPLKKTPMDFIVEKATELGVSKLLPITTKHGNTTRINLDRLSATVRDAAQQCERLSLPVIEPEQPLKALLGQWPDNRRLLVMDETGQAEPLTPILANSDERDYDAILIGPEGGFSPEELSYLDSQRCVVRATLGRRILRAETAALCALSLWQGLRGDGNMPPRQ